jgi:hypothetical protein
MKIKKEKEVKPSIKSSVIQRLRKKYRYILQYKASKIQILKG